MIVRWWVGLVCVESFLLLLCFVHTQICFSGLYSMDQGQTENSQFLSSAGQIHVSVDPRALASTKRKGACALCCPCSFSLAAGPGRGLENRVWGLPFM